MTLRQQQSLFAPLVAQLICWVYIHDGWELSLDECYRPPELAQLYAKQGRGIARSLHTEKLAIDLNLFKNGRYCRKVADYAPLGEYWKSLHPLARWGGDFTRSDARHFSLSRGGRA